MGLEFPLLKNDVTLLVALHYYKPADYCLQNAKLPKNACNHGWITERSYWAQAKGLKGSPAKCH